MDGVTPDFDSSEEHLSSADATASATAPIVDSTPTPISVSTIADRTEAQGSINKPVLSADQLTYTEPVSNSELVIQSDENPISELSSSSEKIDSCDDGDTPVSSPSAPSSPIVDSPDKELGRPKFFVDYAMNIISPVIKAPIVDPHSLEFSVDYSNFP